MATIAIGLSLIVTPNIVNPQSMPASRVAIAPVWLEV